MTARSVLIVTTAITASLLATPARALAVASDFNGDGVADLAVGVPDDSVIFNGDGRSDLATGSPSEGVGGATAAGAVTILYGSASGLTPAGSQFVTEASVRAVPGQ